MRISQAIRLLDAIVEDHGDMDLVVLEDAEEYFAIIRDRIFEVLECPTEDETTLVKVCAFVEPPIEEIKPKPQLRLIT